MFCELWTYILQDKYLLIKHAHQSVSIRAGQVGAEVHGLDRGLRLLAWPFWAAAPFGQARRAPPFMLMSHIRGLLACKETNTEADVVATVAGGAADAPS